MLQSGGAEEIEKMGQEALDERRKKSGSDGKRIHSKKKKREELRALRAQHLTCAHKRSSNRQQSKVREERIPRKPFSWKNEMRNEAEEKWQVRRRTTPSFSSFFIFPPFGTITS